MIIIVPVITKKYPLYLLQNANGIKIFTFRFQFNIRAIVEKFKCEYGSHLHRRYRFTLSLTTDWWYNLENTLHIISPLDVRM